MKLRRLYAQLRPARWLPLACALAVPALCPAQVETVPIRFSKPFDPLLTNNFSALVAKDEKKSFQQLLKETDNHGLSALLRDEPMLGSLPMDNNRPQLSPAALQKYREAADRKKNWGFTIEEDVANDPKVAEMLKLLDAQQDSDTDNPLRKESVIEKYFNKLDKESGRKNAGDLALERGKLDAGTSPSELGKDQDDKDATSVGKRTGNKLPGAGLFELMPRPDFSGTLAKPSKDATDFRNGSLSGLSITPAQRSRLDAFRDLISSSPAAPLAVTRPAPVGVSPLAAPIAGGSVGYLERLTPGPMWQQPSTLPRTPLPSVSTAVPQTPNRMVTPFSTMPTRRQ